MAVAVGRDDTLPVLTGIRVEFEGDRLVLAATDRYRLAVRELTWTPGGTDSARSRWCRVVHWRRPLGRSATPSR